MTSKIGKLHKPKKPDSKYTLTGILYLLGIPVSVGVKKNQDGGYDVESFGIVERQEQDMQKRQPVKSDDGF